MRDRFLWVWLLFFTLLWSCTPKEDPPKPEPEPQTTTPSIGLLSGSQSDLVFPETGSEIKVMFSATADWTAQVLSSTPGSWCTVTPDKGKAGSSVSVTVRTDNNGTEDDRTATVVLLCGSAKVSIAVTQKSKAALTVTKSQFDFGPEGGQFTIEAKANVELTCEIGADCKGWISPASSRAMTTSYFQFVVAANEGDQRSGTIVLKSGSLSETVTVTQEASRPSILLDEANREIKGESGTVVIPLKTNVPVTVVIPKEIGWIHYVTTRAMESREVVLTVDDNDTGETRSGSVFLANEENGINEQFTIVQESLPVVEMEEFYTVGPEGGNIDIKLSTNLAAYKVVIPQEASSWLTHVSTRAMHTDILTFSVAATTLYEPRQAGISVQDNTGNTLKRFTIKQNAKAIPNNEIWYTTKYGYTIEPDTQGFNCRLRENVYADGHGRLIFDDDLLKVGSGAFAGQTSLIGVTLPNSVTHIDRNAFKGCSSMTDLYLPSSLVKAETDAFAGCTGTIYFNGLKLPDYCCTNATALTGLILGDQVETLGQYAFDGCSSLATVLLPESLKQIGDYCFRNCTSLTAVSPANQAITIGNYAFYGAGILEFTWCDAMTVLSYAFSHSPLQKVTFVEPSGIFYYKYSLSTGVFESTKLTEITLSSHIKGIGAYAFKDTPLKKIVMGDALSQIGNDAFSGCVIPEIIIQRSTPPSVGSNVFNRRASTLYVPEGTELTYALSPDWYPYFAAGYIKGFNGFYDFLETGFDKNYEPYAQFYAKATIKDSFPLKITFIGIVADTNESNLTYDKAAYLKTVSFSESLKESESSTGDSRYYYHRPTFAGLGNKTLKYRAFARFEGTDAVWYSSTKQLGRARSNFQKATTRLDGAANCYLVKPGATVSFDATYGGSNIPVNAVGMKVVWESDGSTQAVATGSVISKAIYQDWGDQRDINTIDIYAGSKEGNAVVAALDAYGDILWSWHIWVTSTGTDDMKQVYRNVPLYIMDRNLGALSATPGDPKATGLVYQWGRKDPYPGLNQFERDLVFDTEATFRTGTVSYAIHNPARPLIRKDNNGEDWVSNPDNEPQRWSSEKGFYDPCPAGWRVPEAGPYGIWDNAVGSRSSYYHWDSALQGSDMQEVFQTEGPCWYPATNYYNKIILWGCNDSTDRPEAFPWGFKGDDRLCSIDYRDHPQWKHAVRCVSEKGFGGGHEGTGEIDWNL